MRVKMFAVMWSLVGCSAVICEPITERCDDRDRVEVRVGCELQSTIGGTQRPCPNGDGVPVLADIPDDNTKSREGVNPLGE